MASSEMERLEPNYFDWDHIETLSTYCGMSIIKLHMH